MPQSLANILVHVVFSTKLREPFLREPFGTALHAYLAQTVRGYGCECYRVGGMAEHVHLAIRLGRVIAIAELVEQTKVASSKWLKQQDPALEQFAWQRGYGAFSVGQDDLPALLRYIDGQAAHHADQSFEDEYRAAMRSNGLAFDERYVWD